MYFAFGQADITRNGTQTAADAAALAAAQDSRDQLKLEDFLDDLGNLFDGKPAETADGCAEAARFAARNDADNLHCDALTDGRWGFTVESRSSRPMGDSIIDGTENEHAKATATAVVEPRCSFAPDESAAPSEGGDDRESANANHRTPSPGKLVCDTKDWIIDPEKPDLLPDMADLFTVRLAED
ncbi:hypothetical protein [Streptomyces sp. ISL-1]|uniref:hypothetical protein n=1 Tax=Streptomyces sp. ISL-1 TaxID=2817657 RepID=UPI0035ABAE07